MLSDTVHFEFNRNDALGVEMELLIRVLLGATGILSVLSVPSASGQCENKQLAKLHLAGEGSFGQVVVLEGDAAMVRGSSNDPLAYRQLHIFNRLSGQWQLATSLNGGPTGYTDQFGFSADMRGGRIAVGAPNAVGSNGLIQGAVHVFHESGGTWTLDAVVKSPLTGSAQVFGDHVAIDGNTLLAWRKGETVDVYERGATTWTHTGTLAPAFPVISSGFGYFMDVHGTVAAIGAFDESETAFGEGAVYVFERDGTGIWIQTAKLIPDAQSDYGTFGRSIAVRGNRILVGAGLGHSFLFEKIGLFWAQVATLKSSDAGAAPSFGFAVGLGDDVAVVSAPDLSVPGGALGAGAAYAFIRENGAWKERMKLVANDPLTCSKLGFATSVSGSEVLLGAPPAQAVMEGSAYVFSLVPNPVPEYGVGCAGSGNFVPALSMKQSFDGCKHPGDSVTLDVKNGIGGSFCVLVFGTQAATMPLAGGCTLLTIPSPATTTLPLFGIGPGNGAIAVSASIPVGFPLTSIFMQGFTADPGIAQGYAATNGLRLTVY